jgi:hypothetical protein
VAIESRIEGEGIIVLRLHESHVDVNYSPCLALQAFQFPKQIRLDEQDQRARKDE